MLEAEGVRPTDATTIYRHDIDVSVVTEQLRRRSEKLKTAIDSGNVTLSIREPTSTLLAALVVDVTNFTEKHNRLVSLLNQTGDDLGVKPTQIELDMGSKQIGFNIESYQTSAYVSQKSFEVDNLP